MKEMHDINKDIASATLIAMLQACHTSGISYNTAQRRYNIPAFEARWTQGRAADKVIRLARKGFRGMETCKTSHLND
jgi:hypothetical protein